MLDEPSIKHFLLLFFLTLGGAKTILFMG